MKSAKFEGVVLPGHKEHAVEVPFDPERRWSQAAQPLWRGRRGHAVRGKLNGRYFESSIVPRSKEFWLLLDAVLLESARVEAGDTVEIVIEPVSDDDGGKPRPKTSSKRKTASKRSTRTKASQRSGRTKASSRSRHTKPS